MNRIFPGWASVLFLALLALHCTEPEPPIAPQFYTVVRGDTLTRIARAHGTTVDALRQTNPTAGDHIEVGQVLLIPGLGISGAAPAPSGARPARRSGAGGRAKPAAPSLRMPAAQPCLAGPSLNGSSGEEPEMAASAGLSHAQVSAAMNPMLEVTTRCVTGDWPVGVITLGIQVACTGRVAHVTVADAGGMDPTLVACVQHTLRHTAFPAHDMPDGFSFTYPMRFGA